MSAINIKKQFMQVSFLKSYTWSFICCLAVARNLRTSDDGDLILEISTTMYNIIIRNNGLNGFYKGFYFPLITNGTINALVFGTYGSVMR